MKIITRTLLFLAILLSQFSVDAQSLLTTQGTLPCLDKKFTIVAHIVRDTFGETNIDEIDIANSMDTLNLYFAPICASFEICEFNYINNFQYDVLQDDRPEFEEMMTKFNRENRINMYFVTAQEGNPLCGFATLNGIAQHSVTDVGIVILKSCVGPGFQTIPHEMGHFFNLLHTFEGADDPLNSELVDGSNCDTAGDEICDTPADPYIPGDPVSEYVDLSQGCRFVSLKRDGNGDYYVPDVGNVMSYYPGSCDCGFTYGQYVRMAEAYLNAPEKVW